MRRLSTSRNKMPQLILHHQAIRSSMYIAQARLELFLEYRSQTANYNSRYEYSMEIANELRRILKLCKFSRGNDGS